MQTHSPRTNRGEISARYVGATTVVCPMPMPAINRPAYNCPRLPVDAELRKIAMPIVQTTQSCLVAHRRPILSVITNAIRAPAIEPNCTIDVMLPRRSAICVSLSVESSPRLKSLWKLACEAEVPMRPSSTLLAAPISPKLQVTVSDTSLCRKK